jgi:hypothetical protein
MHCVVSHTHKPADHDGVRVFFFFLRSLDFCVHVYFCTSKEEIKNRLRKQISFGLSTTSKEESL